MEGVVRLLECSRMSEAFRIVWSVAGEMVLLVKCLLCKQKDLGLIPRTHVKMLTMARPGGTSLISALMRLRHVDLKS